MTIFWTILLITTVLYGIGLLCFTVGLFFTNDKRAKQTPFVSVVVAARNEEKNISKLLTDLTNQNYPKNNFEVIIVDNQSVDSTHLIVEKFSKKNTFIKCFRQNESPKSMASKKSAINLGIQKSQGDIILTTDADCRVKPTWVETMVSYFTPETGMVIGFSQLSVKNKKQNWIQKIQNLDFLSLLSAAQGASNLGYPLAATGQNLAYRKRAFQEVGGFKSVGQRISGDDVLLLQLIRKQTNWKVRFSHSEKSFNTSKPESTLTDMLNQRTRWASNGIYQWVLNKRFFFYVLNTYLCNLFLFAGLLLSILKGQWAAWLIAILIKGCSEGLLFLKGSFVYKRMDLLPWFPIWFLFQIPYVVIVGLLGSLGIFSWKNKTYRQSHWSHK